jgi:hypothetical protein
MLCTSKCSASTVAVPLQALDVRPRDLHRTKRLQTEQPQQRAIAQVLELVVSRDGAKQQGELHLGQVAKVLWGAAIARRADAGGRVVGAQTSGDGGGIDAAQYVEPVADGARLAPVCDQVLAVALEAQPVTPPPWTGIDYLGMVVAAHEEQLLGHLGIEICRPRRSRSNNEPRTLGYSLRLHAHAVSKSIPATQLCDRASHQEAVARVRFCISGSLLGVVAGEVGVGKTVAVSAANSQSDATAHHIIYVATPTFGAHRLYLTIVHALGAKPRAQKADLIAQTQTLLAAEEHERRRRVVFIIGEAHLLAPEQLEELRLSTNAVIWTIARIVLAERCSV